MFSAVAVNDPQCICQSPPETTLRFRIEPTCTEGVVKTAVQRSATYASSEIPSRSARTVAREMAALVGAHSCLSRPSFAHKKRRAVSTASVADLRLPGVLDDFYLNVLHWGAPQGASRLAVACVNEVLILDPQLNVVSSFGGSSSGRRASLGLRGSNSLTEVIAQTIQGIVVGSPADMYEPPHTSGSDIDQVQTPRARINYMRRPSEFSSLSNDRAEYTSARWSRQGKYLALGMRSGDIQIWDAEVERVTTTLGAHSQRVGVLDWVPGLEHQMLLASGSRDKSLVIHDLRTAIAAVELDKHKQEVCGLAWRPAGQRDPEILKTAPIDPPRAKPAARDDTWSILEENLAKSHAHPQLSVNELRQQNFAALTNSLITRPGSLGGGGTRNSVCTLASGGNDNKVYLWELGQSQPIAKFAEHSAAVKALAWAPTQRGVLATGGGTNDRTIRLWDTENRLELCSTETESQVCNLYWSPRSLEILSTHGYTLNQLNLWNLHELNAGRKLRLGKVETLAGHTSRVLFLTSSPDGRTVATVSGDGFLKVWELFDLPDTS